MSYTREQRAANAAKAAMSAEQVTETPQSNEPAEPARDETVRLPPRNEPRRQAMEEILASREQTEPTPVEVAPEPVAPSPEAILAANTPADPIVETPVIETPVIEMVKVKIDGVESEVPKTEIDEEGGIVAYQRNKASENRLAKVNQELAETKKLQAQMVSWIQQNQKPAAPVETDDQFIASRMDAIRFGTVEQSAAAMREVLQRSNPKVDQGAITQGAISEFKRQSAVENFNKEFQDVATNPLLKRLAISLEMERGPQAWTDPRTDWNDFFRKIGNEVRSVSARPYQPSTPTATPAAPATGNTSQVSDKEARKSSIVNLPTAAARAALPTESKPETREDTLNNMRKSRGIPTA